MQVDVDRVEYFCTNCGHHVASSDDLVQLDGSSEHEFRAPSGLRWNVTLFRAALGTQPIGELIAEFCWFDGFRYRFLDCASCAEQLGWAYYRARDIEFVALADEVTDARAVRAGFSAEAGASHAEAAD